MDFGYSQKVRTLQDRLQAFMAEHIYPNEQRYFAEAEDAGPWGHAAVLDELKPIARAEGLWNLFLPEEFGGPGLSNLEYAPLCEIMGRSLMAPEVFNCSAPDTGNMETIARYGTPDQKRKWLEPLLDGKIRSALARRLQRQHRVLPVVPGTVKEMLRIVNDLAAPLLEKCDRVADHPAIFLGRNPEHLFDMQEPAFSENRHGGSLGFEQFLYLWIPACRRIPGAGHPERGDLGVFPFVAAGLTEELDILRVAARPAALDVVDPERVQFFRHTDFVDDGKGDSRALRAISEGRVVECEALVGHKRNVDRR